MTKAIGKIYQVIPAIMAEVGAIGKDGWNEKQRFAFRSIDAICNRLHGLLAKHGVFVVPDVIDEPTVTTGTNRNGNLWHHLVFRVKYTFFAEDGSSVEATVTAEAADYQDKAAQKAMTFGFKAALLQVFCVPTEDTPDPDADSPDLSAASGDLPSQQKVRDMVGGKSGPANPPQAPPATAQNPKADARAEFIKAVQAMSDKYLDGWRISEEEAGDVYRQAAELSGLEGTQKVATWMVDHAKLGAAEDSEGVITAITVDLVDAPKETA